MKNKRNYKLTNHFTLGEMTTTQQPYDNMPKDVRTYLNLMKLCHLLEHYRLRTGVIIVNSAFRTPEVNTAVGGHPNSYHMKGLAADIRSPSLSIQAFYATLKNCEHPLYKVDLVKYANFVHVEITNQ